MEEAVSLTLATQADAEAICALTREAYGKWVSIIGREPLPMTVNYSDAIKTDRFDMLQVNGELAAVLQTRPVDDWLLIENVVVLPRFQKRGFGKRLLEFAENLATKMSLLGTRLYTNKLFVENIRIYEALGYTFEKEENLNGGIAIHLVKPRSPSKV